MDWATFRGVLKSQPIIDSGSAEHAQMGHLRVIHSDWPSGPHHVDFGCHTEWLLALDQWFQSTLVYEFQALGHSIIILSNVRIFSLKPIQTLLTFQGSFKGQGSSQNLSPVISIGDYIAQLNTRSDEYFWLKITPSLFFFKLLFKLLEDKSHVLYMYYTWIWLVCSQYKHW